MIETERLVLRNWCPQDAAAHERLHGDPEVAYWLARSPTAPPAPEAIRAMQAFNSTHGYGLRALCLRASGELVGAAGLQPVGASLPVSGIEAAWRLRSDCWGRGYVDEAMRALLADAFARYPFEEVIAFTARSNLRSQAVMRRLGFVADPTRDFDHPRLPDSHPLRPHVFYRLTRGAWAGTGAGGSARG
ncbi:MAG: GNAT family N-acetyltransferase [Proteobacteria bacterium]|nr:GNAT family N-acetyltransferase [Pseudomonadota bacterium]